MHVGVLLADVQPQSGGGYTFIHDVVDALLEHACESSHRFTLLAPSSYVDAMRGRRLSDNVKLVAQCSLGFFDRRFALLRHYVPVFGYFWNSKSKLERQLAGLGIDFVWLAGGVHDTYQIPYVTTVWDVQHLTHPWFPEVSANWRWDHRELFLRRHLRRATSIIVGTQVGKDEIQEFYGVPESRIAILPHPTPAFALRSADEPCLARLPNVPREYLLYPAQFWPHKNHVNLLKALRLLTARNPNTPTLILVGSDKGNLEFVQRRAVELGVAEKLVVLGFVRTEELVALYKNARALVYPSFSGPENLPPLEAFALGCPVVISNYPGAVEQLGSAAAYFDPADPSSIANAIERVLGNVSLRNQLIEIGKIRASKWTGREFVAGVFKIFDEFESQRCCWP